MDHQGCGSSERDYPAWLAAAVSGVLLCLGASTYLFWKDVGELTTAAVDMGVPHPTGFPLWTALARICGLLPLGTFDLKVSMASVLPMAGCIGLASVLCGLVLQRQGLQLTRSMDTLVRGVCLPLLILSSETVWYLGTTPEVYALGAFLSLLFVVVLLHERYASRRIESVGALIGLAINTHVIAGLGLIAAGLRSFIRSERSSVRNWLRRGSVPFVLGAGGVLALIAAASRGPAYNFGNPSTLGDLFRHLSADSIRKAFSAPGSRPEGSEVMQEHLSFLGSDVGWVLLIFAVLGFGLARRDRIAQTLGLLFVLEMLYNMFVNPMGRIDQQTGLLSVFSIHILAVLGAVQLKQVFQRDGWAWGTILILLLSQVPTVLDTADDRLALRHDVTATRWMRVASEGMPSNPIVFTTNDNSTSTLLAAQRVEGRRPDAFQVLTSYAWWPWRLKHLTGDEEQILYTATKSALGADGYPRDDKSYYSLFSVWRKWTQRAGRPIVWDLGNTIATVIISEGSTYHPGFPYGRVAKTEAVGDSSVVDVAKWTVAHGSVHRWSRDATSHLLTLQAMSLLSGTKHGSIEQLQSAEEAREWTHAAIQIAPGNASAWLNLGALLRPKNLNASILAYREAKKLGHARAGKGLNAALMLRENLPRIIGKQQARLQAQPNEPEAWLQLGDFEHQLGRQAQAREAWEKAFSVAQGMGRTDIVEHIRLRRGWLESP